MDEGTGGARDPEGSRAGRGGPSSRGRAPGAGRPARATKAAAPRAATDEPVGPLERAITLIGGPASCAAARQFVRAVLGEGIWGGDQEAAVLLTSEIVSNAAQHAGGACHLMVRVDAVVLRIEATDRSRIRPHLSIPEPLDETGRGLLLVDVLSHDWGTTERLDGGKAVWFELHS